MAYKTVLPFIFINILLNPCSCEMDVDYTPQGVSTHIDTVLAEYDREVSPASKVLVTLSLELRYAHVDDEHAVMQVLVDMTISWKDPRLSWNTTSWAGESVIVSTERLWTPDITLLNAAGTASAADGGAIRARITSDGSVLSVTRMDVSVPVTLQLENWPYDSHEAVFKFASREHSSDEIDLDISDFKSKLIENGVWDASEISGELSRWVRAEGVTVSVVSARVRVTRRGDSLAAAASAVFLGAHLVLVAAALRPCAQRPPIAAAAAFVTVVWLVSCVFHVPCAGSVPRAVRCVCALCAACGASGALAALLARIARRTAPPPAALRTLLTRVSAVYSLTPDTESCGECGAWAAASRLLDAVIVTIQIITQIILLIVYYV